MSKAIKELLQQGAIVQCNSSPDQFVSRIFLANKPDGRKRFILNLKHLNTYIDAPHFKMEDIRTALRLVQKDCFLASIDLKEAYFHLPIHPDHRKYLRFEFQGKIYEFSCLPFGLSSAPYTFTKLIKPIIQSLHSRGITCINYLDDFLIIDVSYEGCCKSVGVVIELLQTLGFAINIEKSTLIPSKVCKFLGFVLDTDKLRIILPKEKKDKIKKWTLHFKNKSRCKIQEFAQFIGFLVAACPAVKYGWMYLKDFDRQKFLALKLNNMNYSGYMTLPSILNPDFQWWLESIDSAYNDIKQDNFKIEVFSDASLSGWGACCGQERTRGWWNSEEKLNHINFLELQAIFYALKCFASSLRSCNILIRCDNTTALSYINKMGSIQHPRLSSLSKQIWRWCEKRNLWLFASYISSSDNWKADQESRALPPETEWALAVSSYDLVTQTLGSPDIDLFASKDNNKCQTYVSWRRDPNAVAVDAFTIFWGNLFFYAFPPFSLILRVLQKIVNDKAEGILVVPLWETQAWYPLFVRLIIKGPVYLKPNKYLLYSPYSSSPHPLADKITLAVARLSGKRSC